MIRRQGCHLPLHSGVANCQDKFHALISTGLVEPGSEDNDTLEHVRQDASVLFVSSSLSGLRARDHVHNVH